MDIVLGILSFVAGITIIFSSVMKFAEDVDWQTYKLVIVISLVVLALFISVHSYRNATLRLMPFKVSGITVVNSEENIYMVTAIKDPGAWLSNDQTTFYTTKHYDFGQEVKD